MEQKRDKSSINSSSIHSEQSTSDSSSTRRREDNWDRESGFINKESKINDWSNFPTQSPICGRNDGIPIELDGITFSKWRQESIKGYGNAIVPQVAYQLFKTIQQLENLQNQKNQKNA